MSLRDDDDTQWSPSSCDDWELEEKEARLYSMVYHNSDTYDEPTPAQHSNSGLILSDNNQRNSSNQTEPVTNGVTIEQPSKNIRPNGEGLEDIPHHSARSKASRLNKVNKIIEIANNNMQSRHDKAVDGGSSPNVKNKRDKNISSKRQTNNKEVPKTASLYFQNLKKTLNNVEYFQSVEPLLSKPFVHTKNKSYARSLSHRNNPGDHPQPPVTNFSFAAPRNTTHNKDVPFFRLDDRLFPNVPKEVQPGTRLFSNKPNKYPAVDGDRYNHLFNQLPFNPFRPSDPSPNDLTKSRKALKKAKMKAKHKNRMARMAKDKLNSEKNSPSSALVQILPSSSPLQTDADIVVVPAIITKLNSILTQIGSNPVTCLLDDDPVEIIQTKSDDPKDSKKNIINVDLSTNEVINLDSDSADSIILITPPSRTPPPVIALSDDETATENKPHLLLETEHCDNSFDFLDCSDDPDALRKSQVSVFTNLISNSGSKESLLDVCLFQRIESVAEVSVPAVVSKPDDETEQEVEMVLLSKQASASSVPPRINPQPVEQAPRVENLPHPSVVIAMQPVALLINPRFRQKETGFNSDNVGVSTAVVNIDDDSSHSNQSIETLSSPNNDDSSPDSSKSSTKTNLILNVKEKSYIDLEINNFLMDNSDNFQDVELAPHERKSLSPDANRKRKRDGNVTLSPSKTPRKKRGKKAREKSRQQLQDFLNKRTGMMALMYTPVEGTNSVRPDEVRPRYPTKWTRDMRRFYTRSWGGENYDVQEVQHSMSADQSLWRISWEDRRGPVPLQGPFRRARCFNCWRFGHPAANCPEPRRITKCHMCGEAGHGEPSCPNKICLQCGRPSNKYASGCWECRHVSHPLCTKCIWKHDQRSPCMDVRRNIIAPGTQPEAFCDVPPCTETIDLREQLERKRSHRRAQSQPRTPRQGGYKRGREDYDRRQHDFRRSRP